MGPVQFNVEMSQTLILLFALGSGILFGILLEKAGFGNAKKLVEQFYFTDMRMFKVLFTAILTGMLGIYWLSYFGVLDITQVYVNATYLWPQVVGGILFGFGFVICGLCPGTSCVAVFTGKMDGLAVFAGIFAGFILFSETEPALSGLINHSPLGNVSLYEVLHMNYGTLTFLIVLVALIAFWYVERVERRVGGKLT